MGMAYNAIMGMDFKFAEDCRLIRNTLGLTQQQLAAALGVEYPTISLWENGKMTPSFSSLDRLYSFAYSKGFNLSETKGQFYLEERKGNEIILFHGSDEGIVEPIDLAHSRKKLDFGPGFYCGENYRQSASFALDSPRASFYVLSFENSAAHSSPRFSVDLEWMLAIAFYRGKIDKYADNPLIRKLREKVEKADFIIAPIADNRMFATIDSFLAEDLTDAQTIHALAATDLGMQYVFRQSAVLGDLRILEHLFLSSEEKKHLFSERSLRQQEGEKKAISAKIKYKKDGAYLEEILDAAH